MGGAVALLEWIALAIHSRRATADVVIKGLNRWEQEHGTPTRIFSDGGRACRGLQVQQWCMKRGIEHILMPPFHHSSLGLVERFNQTLLGRL